jgi:hypothetical protein
MKKIWYIVVPVFVVFSFLLLCGLQDRNPRMGYIDSQGQWIIKPRFRFADDFCGDFAAVSFVGKLSGTGDRHGGKFGVIDRSGKIVIKPEYDALQISSNGLARVWKHQKHDVLDIKRQKLWGKPFHWVGEFRDGRAQFVQAPEGPVGYVDEKGNVVVEAKYKVAYDYHNGLARVYGEGWGQFIDTNGLPLGGQTYESVTWFSCGLAAVKRGGKWGYINQAGQMAIAPQFDRAESFSSSLAPVEVGGKYGYVDRSGTIIVKPVYQL